MDYNIKQVLQTIEKNGFEAYVIGGYVRDKLLGIKSKDVDIATNALLKDLKSIFKSGKCSDANYGSYRIRGDKYNFDITTYREEHIYVDRRPTNINYVDNLLTDIHRRDFTINTICMNQKGNIIDLLDGRKDIKNKLIRVIGNVPQKFTEDPLRILRALRFAITLKFNIEEEALAFIINNKKLLNTLSYQRKKDELELILISDNAVMGLNYLKTLGFLDVLEIEYDKIVHVDDLQGMWAQLNFPSKYPFSKYQMNNIKNIRKILNHGIIDVEMLYKYDLYLCMVAGNILGIDKISINKIYKNMQIYCDSDIAIKYNDIVKIFNITDNIVIKRILTDIKKEILANTIKNKKKNIMSYIKLHRKEYIDE